MKTTKTLCALLMTCISFSATAWDMQSAQEVHEQLAQAAVKANSSEFSRWVKDTHLWHALSCMISTGEHSEYFSSKRYLYRSVFTLHEERKLNCENITKPVKPSCNKVSVQTSPFAKDKTLPKDYVQVSKNWREEKATYVFECTLGQNEIKEDFYLHNVELEILEEPSIKSIIVKGEPRDLLTGTLMVRARDVIRPDGSEFKEPKRFVVVQ